MTLNVWSKSKGNRFWFELAGGSSFRGFEFFFGSLLYLFPLFSCKLSWFLLASNFYLPQSSRPVVFLNTAPILRRLHVRLSFHCNFTLCCLQNYKHSLSCLEHTGWSTWDRKWCSKSLAKLARLRFIINYEQSVFPLCPSSEKQNTARVKNGRVKSGTETPASARVFLTRECNKRAITVGTNK